MNGRYRPQRDGGLPRDVMIVGSAMRFRNVPVVARSCVMRFALIARSGMAGEGADLWVFGYGSLMWRPGFAFDERHAATVHGFHRALCVYSHVHRGTPSLPGLVMGLDRGGSCRGLAYRVAPAHAEATVSYLRAREQVTSVYVERCLPIRLHDGRTRIALTYIVDRTHRQYAGRLAEDDLLTIVSQGVGQSGANPDYVIRTEAQLVEIGVRDPVLQRLARRLQR
jgi:glutathione-specific gamma-glutamylcyclotransferase